MKWPNQYNKKYQSPTERWQKFQNDKVQNGCVTNRSPLKVTRNVKLRTTCVWRRRTERDRREGCSWPEGPGRRPAGQEWGTRCEHSPTWSF